MYNIDMRKHTVLIFFLIIFDILVVFGILIFFKSIPLLTQETVTELKPAIPVLLSNQKKILGASEGIYTKEIKICSRDFCHTINSGEISSWLVNDKVDINKMYLYLADKVYSDFEEKFGGKVTVKSKNGQFLTWKEDSVPDLSDLHLRLKNLFEKRLEGISNDRIEVKIEDLPGTDGKYESKYIEIDNSKQILYSWIEGNVDRMIQLSGPKYGYQVYGVFPIIDKGLSPIAPGGKYMPYWMAFYYSPLQDSWYGLHALIWWYDDSGDKVYESLNNIGQRKSAGCVRMLLEDSKYLYDNFEKGDPILIHE